MPKNKKATIKQINDMLNKHFTEHIKWIANDFHGDTYSVSTINSQVDWAKDFSVLQDFTDEELAQELCRRTELGKELE